MTSATSSVTNFPPKMEEQKNPFTKKPVVKPNFANLSGLNSHNNSQANLNEASQKSLSTKSLEPLKDNH